MQEIFGLKHIDQPAERLDPRWGDHLHRGSARVGVGDENVEISAEVSLVEKEPRDEIKTMFQYSACEY